MAVFAPFDFARIGRWVHSPAWGPLVSHDVPFSDGLSGTATVTITARTPLLVGGQRREAAPNKEGEVWPFKLPDGTWALPPSTLQGHMRTLLEIAGFGRLGDVVERRRFGYREISTSTSAKEHYLSRLTHRDKGVIHPNSQAGWLIRDPVHKTIRIVPCNMARIHINDLRRMRSDLLKVPFRAGPEAEAADKFWHWEGSDAQQRFRHFLGNTTSKNGLESTFAVQPKSNHPHSGDLIIHYARCAPSSAGDAKPGTIVMTGRTRRGRDTPHDGPGQKKQEFVFFGPSRPAARSWTGARLAVPDLAWDAFLLLHDKQRGKAINPNWEFWEKDFELGEPVPVFYWTNADGEIDTMGTAFAFKAAQQLTPRDLLANSSPCHVVDSADAPLDLASLIFGTAAEGNRGQGLRRRAWFGLARDISGKKYRTTHDLGNNAILMSPKPSYANFYVRQSPVQGNVTPRDRPMAMFNPVTNYPNTGTYLSHPELAGVKIWPATEDGANLTLPPPIVHQAQVQTKLNPVPAGTTFLAPLTFHNLRPVELGALLWALSFGDVAAFGPEPADIKRRHRLGMGKPYALGQVSLQISLAIDDADNLEGSWSSGTLVKAFVDHMDAHYPKSGQWAASPQVKALLKASLPSQRRRGQDGQPYMRLDGGAGNRLALETYVGEKVAGGFLAPYVDSAFECDKPRLLRTGQGGGQSVAPMAPVPESVFAVGSRVRVNNGQHGGREATIQSVRVEINPRCKLKFDNGRELELRQGALTLIAPPANTA